MENKKLNFLAIDKDWVTNIPSSNESDTKNGFVEWGTNNKFPCFLNELYENVPTLHSIINGIVDYGAGDDVKSLIPTISNSTLTRLVKEMVLQYCIYGGVAINVRKNAFGKPIAMDVLDMRCIRSDRKNNVFYYSEEFRDTNKSYGRYKMVKYPAFDCTNKTDANSIYFIKNNSFRTYPLPIYNAAINSCMVEQEINKFHLNSICNGLFSGYLINFNNGVPSDEMREEIEDNIFEKFSGADNAGRIMVSFNDSKDNAVEVQSLDVQDFGEKYNTLASRSRQEIFTVFRANPNLFGINTENNGFAVENFKDAYQLFNKTVIQPIQTIMVDSINEIFGEGSIEIKPFTIVFDTDIINENIN